MLSKDRLAKLSQRDSERRKVLAHHRKLQTDVARTISDVGSGACSIDEIIDRLHAMQEDTSAFGEYLSIELEPKYYNEIRVEESTTASKVFSIPELSELILLHARVNDVMAMEQVNRDLRNIISASPKLRSKLYLKPEDAHDRKREYLKDPSQPYYRSHFSNRAFSGFNTYACGMQIEATFKRINVRTPLPKIGERLMKMFICQPPIKTLYVQSMCAKCDLTESEQTKITSADGFTLHELWETAKELFATRITCLECIYLTVTGEPSGMTKPGEIEFSSF